MEATKDFLSLETNKLLKDCEIDSEYFMSENGDIITSEEYYNFEDYVSCVGKPSCAISVEKFFPAFTWGEILWEYAEEFFGKNENNLYHICGEGGLSDNYCPNCNNDISWDDLKYAYRVIPTILLDLLQQKKYNEADLYFRENTILIKK